MPKTFFFAAILAACLVNSSQACTVWGTLTPNELLIAKNRDFYPGNQKFLTIQHKNKYKFFGLYGDKQYDNQYSIKMGVNETGLAAFMTFASTIPLKQRAAKISYEKVMENILENYHKVDDIKKNSKLLFSNSTPINYIFADRSKAMLCEIALNNQYQCKIFSRNSNGETVIFAQTNHYILENLTQYNLTPVIDQQTSYLRLNKITALMVHHLSELNLDQFIRFSFNTEAANDNPLAKFDKGYDNTYQDNSIFRTFNSHPDRKNKQYPNSDQAVSSMIIKLPKNDKAPIELYLRLIDNITDLNDKNHTQHIHYTFARTTLDQAIHDPSSINYQQGFCKRDVSTKICA
ncbi:MAG: Acyl-coenzyme A:6-aminopenicillanic acid acyl-transferase [Gammaproteobacteria bacterium]|jgi:hypothetical protein|nr:Acyl-coenzyme A:6-aminopenicillanic acid acyl-transferase [Gammaproteobacteria bacterium]